MVVEAVEEAVGLCVDVPAVEGEAGVVGGELGGRGDVADAVAVGAGEEVDVGLGDFDVGEGAGGEEDALFGEVGQEEGVVDEEAHAGGFGVAELGVAGAYVEL